MRALYTNHNYIVDPHGTLGYLGLKEYLKEHPDAYDIFLETAHPVKFLSTVKPIVGKYLELPDQVKNLVNKGQIAHNIANYDELKGYLTLIN